MSERREESSATRLAIFHVQLDFDRGSLINERNSLTIEGEKITVVCTQIAGIVARRIVCWKKLGDTLALGERFGLIKFSSRTDLQMPFNVDVLVKVDDKVKGGETIIGRIKEIG